MIKTTNRRPSNPPPDFSADEVFFFLHAAYSHAPRESPRTGLIRCARQYANAERIGRNAGYSFQWSIDPENDSSDFSDEMPAWKLWQCVARDGTGAARGSLGGIDFGRDGEPWGDHYRRCVEAELLLEAL